MNRPWIIRGALGMLLVAAVALAPFLARASAKERRRLSAHEAAIAALSPAERARLLRNYEHYQAMSPAERTQAQQFQQTLAADREAGRGELTQTLQLYDQWLKTLAPFEREQLHQAPGAEARLAAVKDIMQKKPGRTADRSLWVGMRGRGPQTPVLDTREFDQLVKQLEAAATPRLSSAQLEQLAQAQGLERDIALLRALRELDPERRPLGLTVPREIQRLAQTAEQDIPSPTVKAYLAQGEADQKALRLVRVIGHSLFAKMWQERFRQQRQPNTQELKEFLDHLPDRERDALLTLEASDFLNELTTRYLASKGDTRPGEIGDLFRLGGERGFPGDGRVDGRGDGRGDGRRFNEPRGESGGPMGRPPGDRENPQDGEFRPGRDGWPPRRGGGFAPERPGPPPDREPGEFFEPDPDRGPGGRSDDRRPEDRRPPDRFEEGADGPPRERRRPEPPPGKPPTSESQ